MTTTHEVLKELTYRSLSQDQFHYDFWEEFPEIEPNFGWVMEIIKLAESISKYDEITRENINDISYEEATLSSEDSTENIAKRFFMLSLYDYPELDDEVAERFQITTMGTTANEIMSAYLYCAIRGLAYRVATYALDKSRESSSDSDGAV